MADRDLEDLGDWAATGSFPVNPEDIYDAVWDDAENDVEIRNVCPRCHGARWLIGGRGQPLYDCPTCDGKGHIE